MTCWFMDDKYDDYIPLLSSVVLSITLSLSLTHTRTTNTFSQLHSSSSAINRKMSLIVNFY